MESSRTTKNNLQRACYGPREHFYGIDFLRTPVKMPLSPILDFYRRLANLSPGEVVAKTKQCCKLHCYARYHASLGGPERLYLGPDPPSTLTANLH